MRPLPLLIAASLLALPLTLTATGEELLGAPPEADTAGHQPNTYRYGYVYASEGVTTPTACEARCNSDTACSSWSTTPTAPDTDLRCDLKRNIGRATYRPGAVSGVASKYQPVAMAPQQATVESTESE